MQAVILAGGKGTRLSPFTKVFPKPLVPLGEKPILDTILRQLKFFGFTHITLAVGHMADMFHTYARNGEQYGIEISYCVEEEPLGTVGPLKQMIGLEDRFLVMNGDLITNLDYREIIDFHKSQSAMATIGTFQKALKIELGIIHSDEASHAIVDYVEKPVFNFKVSMGIYVFEKAILDYIEPNQYLDFPDLVKRLLADGQPVASYPFSGYWLDIGNHSDYETAVEEYESIKENLHIG